MCGELKLEKRSFKLGNYIPIIEDKLKAKGVWAGFAKIESINNWVFHTKAKSVKIPVDSFIEGKYIFKVSCPLEGIMILGWDKIWPTKEGAAISGTIKIITRSPVSEFEKSIHNRWPVIQTPKGIHQFTVDDIEKGQLSLKGI